MHSSWCARRDATLLPPHPSLVLAVQDTPTRAFVFCADSDEALQQWLSAVRAALAALHNGAGPQPSAAPAALPRAPLREGMAEALLRGWLWKRDHDSGKWRRRWFEAWPHCLQYRVSETTKRVQAVVDLQGARLSEGPLVRVLRAATAAMAATRHWPAALHR